MRATPEKPNRVQAWTYVFIQAVLLALLLFLTPKLGPQVHRLILVGSLIEWMGILGVLISAASLRRSLTAVPIPKQGGELSMSGLYRFVRHPMYSSVLLLALGIALHSGCAVKYLLVICLYFLFHFKSVYEEKYLRLKYPEYADYSSQIPRFIPFLK